MPTLPQHALDTLLKTKRMLPPLLTVEFESVLLMIRLESQIFFLSIWHYHESIGRPRNEFYRLTGGHYGTPFQQQKFAGHLACFQLKLKSQPLGAVKVRMYS